VKVTGSNPVWPTKNNIKELGFRVLVLSIEPGTRFEGKHWRRCTADDIGDHVQKAKGWVFGWAKVIDKGKAL